MNIPIDLRTYGLYSHRQVIVDVSSLDEIYGVSNSGEFYIKEGSVIRLLKSFNILLVQKPSDEELETNPHLIFDVYLHGSEGGWSQFHFLAYKKITYNQLVEIISIRDNPYSTDEQYFNALTENGWLPKRKLTIDNQLKQLNKKLKTKINNHEKHKIQRIRYTQEASQPFRL